MSEKRKDKSANSKREGVVLVLSLVFILGLSALAASAIAISRTNAHVASDRQKAASALASAISGLEVNRYWLSRVAMPSSTPPSAYFRTIIDALQNELAANDIFNITLTQNGFLSPAMLHSRSSQCFTGQILVNPANPSILQVYSTGGDGRITRTIGACFEIEPYRHPVFTFGLASKGPLRFSGNPSIKAAGQVNLYAVAAENSAPPAVADQADFDENVTITGPADGMNIEFPIPDTEHFRQYATGPTIDSSSDLTGDMILTNAGIAAGTNPHFKGRVTIEGILFIESPNIVTFGRDVVLEGLIAATGDADNPGTNRIDFCSDFHSGPYPAGAEFDAIRSEKGSSMLAPGFAVSFSGHSSTLEGVVAVSGARFSGNVSTVIKSTFINYSERPLDIEGGAAMSFERQSGVAIPAGFDTHRVLTYNPSSYEVLAM